MGSGGEGCGGFSVDDWLGNGGGVLSLERVLDFGFGAVVSVSGEMAASWLASVMYSVLLSAVASSGGVVDDSASRLMLIADSLGTTSSEFDTLCDTSLSIRSRSSSSRNFKAPCSVSASLKLITPSVR